MHAYGEDANDCLKDKREEFMESITKVRVFKLKPLTDIFYVDIPLFIKNCKKNVKKRDDPSLSFKRSGWLDYSQWCW